jgi:hypothetical protein
MVLSRSLMIAVVAMALLVGSVTFEVVFQRTYALQVHDPPGWQTIGQSASANDVATPRAGPASHAILAARNASIDFRLRVDNGYPWASSQHYDIVFNGLSVADGTIAAPARGVGETPFTIPAATLLRGSGGPKEIPGGNVTYVNLNAVIGSESIYATFQLQEAN